MEKQGSEQTSILYIIKNFYNRRLLYLGYVYKITNDINGKVYIGKTELVDPYDRWKEHLQDYKKKEM